MLKEKRDNKLLSWFLLRQQYCVYIFNLSCILWIILQIYFSYYLPFSIDQLKVFHLCFAISIILLDFITKNNNEIIKIPKNILFIYSILGLSILAILAYFFINYEIMIENIGYPGQIDIILGLIFLIALFIATYKVWGKSIVIITILSLLYALFGNYFKGLLYHSGIDLPRLIGYACTYYMGALGNLTTVSSTLIIYFLIFGTLLQALGGEELILELSKIIGSKFRSGTAQTAVIASAMLGMVTGSTASNVAITGSLTIPMMKRRGYNPDFAGAIEATASMGGQIMPPVMGITAFIISNFTNIPYRNIVIAAILPALVYYLNISFVVFLRTEKIYDQLSDFSSVKNIKFKNFLKYYGHLLIPVIVLTWRILIGSPSRAVLFGIFTLVIVSFIHSILLGYQTKKITTCIKDYTNRLSKGLIEGAKSVSKVAIVLGCMGIIMETFTFTGFGQRLSYSIVDIAGENYYILIGLVTLLTIFFGMGMPTPGAYILTALLSAPILINYGGFSILSVHMFIFYFAVISAITPPVAIASLVAIGISGGSFLRTSLNAFRLSLPGFLLPFYFLFQPVVLGAQKDFPNALIANTRILIGTMLIITFSEAFFFKKLTFLDRIFCLIAGVFILIPGKLFMCMSLGIILLFIYSLFIHQNFKKN